MMKKSVKDCIPWERPHTGRETVREGAVKTDHSTHSSSTLHFLGQERREAEQLGRKMCLSREGVE